MELVKRSVVAKSSGEREGRIVNRYSTGHL